MSISATLANALTGLSAASRAAQVVSSNVANSTTEGYARREIELSARVAGGVGAGVEVDGVVRIVDETLVRDRRSASAAVGHSSALAEFHRDLLGVLGEPQDPASLSALASDLESSLLAATSRPESDARLFAVLTSAQSLAGQLNAASDQIQSIRVDADGSIALDIERLNSGLETIADLNGQILRARGSDQDYPGLLDNRQKAIDDISALVPIRQLPRENGTVALYTQTGALLVDIEPAVFGFEATGTIAPDMTLASGALSGVTLNGRPIQVSGDNAPLAGGRIAGLFAVRDQLAVSAQDNLDAVARDLLERFEDPGLDPSLMAGDPGLFTDQGLPLDPLNIEGLAGRVAVNALVDPGQGGEIRRLRDGLGSTLPGAVGDASLLDAMRSRLLEARSPIGGAFSSAPRSLADLTVDLTSMVGLSVVSDDTRLGFEQARLAGLEEALLADGVDTDQEMQKLLLIEQAYAANARVIRTADELIQLLIGL